MDEAELRRTLEAEVGKVPDGIWQFLSDEGHLRVEGESDFRALVATARRALLLLKPVRAKRKKPTRSLASRGAIATIRMSKAEELRQDALSAYFAGEAAANPDVRRFRSEVLADRLLSDDEARDWLRSAAVRTFGREAFKARGVDPVQHRATLVSEETTRDHDRAVIRLEPEGTDWTYEQALNAGSRRDGASISFKIKTDGLKTISGQYRRGSLIDHLLTTAARLVLPGYPHDADVEAWFLLTGHLPPALAINGSWTMSDRPTHRIAAISLEMAPWVSSRTVVAAYRQMQRELLKRHNHPMSQRRLALFQFVTEQTDPGGRIPRWRGLMAEWNRRFRRWRYVDVRNMSRDYWASARLLLTPEYHFTD